MPRVKEEIACSNLKAITNAFIGIWVMRVRPQPDTVAEEESNRTDSSNYSDQPAVGRLTRVRQIIFAR